MNQPKPSQKRNYRNAVLLALFVIGFLFLASGIVKLYSNKPEFEFSGLSFIAKNGLADLIFGVILLVAGIAVKTIFKPAKNNL